MERQDGLLNLAKVRPKLRVVAPLTTAICWGYAVINAALGFGMYFLYHTPVPLSIANLLSYQVWGVIFLLLGLVTGYGLLANNWHLTKETQFAGVILKSIWAIALILRCLTAPQTILITLVWLFFAYIQIVTYIHFLPPAENLGHALQ